MADDAKDAKPVNPVPQGGDHDRVVMLSLRADGSPDQHDPEIIGDKDAAVEAAKEQFRQQAVSAVDVQLRGVSSDDAGSTEPSPEEKALKDAHDKAAAAAEKAAEAAVSALYQG